MFKVIFTMILLYLLIFIRALYLNSYSYMTFINVGQGDSIFIHTVSGINVLVDGGNSYDVLNYINVRQPYPFCTLDFVFLTHPHADHLYGLNRLLKYCTINYLVFDPLAYKSKMYASFLSNASRLKEQGTTKVLSSQEFMEMGYKDLFIKVLYPNQAKVTSYKNVNDASIVLLIDYKNFEALLTGDISGTYLDSIDQNSYKNRVQGRFDVLKMPHHGSITGLNETFISALNPLKCVISLGKNNSYKHPHSEVIVFLNNLKCPIFRTDANNNIEIRMN